MKNSKPQRAKRNDEEQVISSVSSASSFHLNEPPRGEHWPTVSVCVGGVGGCCGFATGSPYLESGRWQHEIMVERTNRGVCDILPLHLVTPPTENIWSFISKKLHSKVHNGPMFSCFYILLRILTLFSLYGNVKDYYWACWFSNRHLGLYQWKKKPTHNSVTSVLKNSELICVRFYILTAAPLPIVFGDLWCQPLCVLCLLQTAPMMLSAFFCIVLPILFSWYRRNDTFCFAQTNTD